MSLATKKINQRGSLCRFKAMSKTVASNYHQKWWQLVNFPRLFLTLCQAVFVSDSEKEGMSS